MISPAKLQLADTLKYSDRFDYPLTLDEIWYWQIGTSCPKSTIKRALSAARFYPQNGFYFLPGRSQTIQIRQSRYAPSQKKLVIANSVARLLSRIPTIEAIFITGALAMNNSSVHDDIDFMIITHPHSLWLTRFLVYLYLHLCLHVRRPARLPEHASPRVSNTICDNLYLESSHLRLKDHDLFVAHELLQAKCVFDRSNVAQKILQNNPWLKNYLPIAYTQKLALTPTTKTNPSPHLAVWMLLVWPINLLLFVAQYLYMKPKITNERVTLHTAFFHPQRPLDKKILVLIYMSLAVSLPLCQL